MEDFLAEGKPWRKVANVLGKVGVKVPVPVKLRRAEGGWSNKAFENQVALVGGAIEGGPTALKDTISTFGFTTVDTVAKQAAYHALVFDATLVDTTDKLQQLYAFYHAALPTLARNGRIVIIGKSATATAEEAATQQALVGFMKALSKEVGKKGVTVNLIRAEGSLSEQAAQVAPLLWFLLSNHSSFITGQVLGVNGKVKVSGNITYTKPLQGKTALVTGAARGIGNSIARRLADEGATVVVVDRKEMQAEAEAVANEIKGKTLLLDITSPDAPTVIKDFVKANFQGLDIIIHNAGITRDRTLAKMDKATWDTVIAVNLTAAIRVNDELLKNTLNDNGRIVCMASISGIGGIFGQTNYSATKAGLIGYVKALSDEIASKAITANAIAPGFIETEMTNQIPFMTRETGRRVNAFAQGGLPIDVAELVVFLSTPNSAGVTGQTIRVCGGNIMGA